MSPTGGADTRVCRLDNRVEALERTETSLGAADTSVRATGRAHESSLTSLNEPVTSGVLRLVSTLVLRIENVPAPVETAN